MTGRHGNQSVPADTDAGTARSTRLFALLADARCRYLLYRLREGGPCRLSTLARDIVTHETGTAGDPDPERVRAVYLDLYRTQLPRLAAAGIVDYSEQLGEVTLRRTDEAFTGCLDAAASLDGV